MAPKCSSIRELFDCLDVARATQLCRSYSLAFSAVVASSLLLAVSIMYIYSTLLVYPSSSYYHHLQPLIDRLLLLNLTANHGSDHQQQQTDIDIVDGRDDVKLILFWTPFFKVKDFGFGSGRKAFINAECPVNNCATTSDRNLVNQSDAILFHPINVDVRDLPRQDRRLAHQRYIFLLFEAHPGHRSLPVFRNPVTNVEFFNWTMTYRRDSDVYDSRYGALLRRQHPSAAADRLPATLSPEDYPPDPSSFWRRPSLSSSSSNRTKSVAWFVTNCKTPSLRENYFRQLAKFIAVDIYGGCGPLKCVPPQSRQCDRLLDDYKFYIAAENSICPDYLTEKFYRALAMGVVPVVYGGADYSAYAPPNSYIQAADFESPQALAEYLLLLERNPRLYAKYLDWNKDWEIDQRKRLNGWCRLCEKLNAPTGPSNPVKVYPNMAQWYYDKVPCLSGATIMQQYP
jgi:alpha-1,3-fucosyltransferase